MTDLENNLNIILREKEFKLLPQNIKKGINIFGIKGEFDIFNSAEYQKYIRYAKVILGQNNILEKLEYIESTGSQFINLKIPGNSIYGMEFVWRPISINADYQTYIGGARDDFTLGANKSDITNSFLRYRTKEIYGAGKGAVLSTTEKNTLIINREGIKLNNVSYSGITLEPISDNSANIYICSDNAGDRNANMAFYELKLLGQDDEILYNFIPCINFIENRIGIYDLVNKNFIGNSGTGEFKYYPNNYSLEDQETTLESLLENILKEKNEKLLPENIKNGISILGITGVYTGEEI